MWTYPIARYRATSSKGSVTSIPSSSACFLAHVRLTIEAEIDQYEQSECDICLNLTFQEPLGSVLLEECFMGDGSRKIVHH
jgi:hypothetical protein